MPTAVPTCVPAAPAVVGSGSDRLVVTVPQCSTSAGLTGYRVIASTLDGTSAGSVDVAAYDVRTGVLLWENEADDANASYSAAGNLVIGRSPYSIIGYSVLTGEQVWLGGVPDARGYVYGAAAIAGGRIYISTYDEGVKAYGLP